MEERTGLGHGDPAGPAGQDLHLPSLDQAGAELGELVSADVGVDVLVQEPAVVALGLRRRDLAGRDLPLQPAVGEVPERLVTGAEHAKVTGFPQPLNLVPGRLGIPLAGERALPVVTALQPADLVLAGPLVQLRIAHPVLEPSTSTTDANLPRRD
jgi:hypothetical protein